MNLAKGSFSYEVGGKKKDRITICATQTVNINEKHDKNIINLFRQLFLIMNKIFKEMNSINGLLDILQTRETHILLAYLPPRNI